MRIAVYPKTGPLLGKFDVMLTFTDAEFKYLFSRGHCTKRVQRKIFGDGSFAIYAAKEGEGWGLAPKIYKENAVPNWEVRISGSSFGGVALKQGGSTEIRTEKANLDGHYMLMAKPPFDLRPIILRGSRRKALERPVEPLYRPEEHPPGEVRRIQPLDGTLFADETEKPNPRRHGSDNLRTALELFREALAEDPTARVVVEDDGRTVKVRRFEEL